jgi:hypothetical protein
MPASPQDPLSQLIRSDRKAVECPLFWTSEHLQQVGCRFDDFCVSANGSSSPLAIDHTSQPSGGKDALTNEKDDMLSDVERLAASDSPEVKSFTIKKLLVGDGLPYRKSW